MACFQHVWVAHDWSAGWLRLRFIRSDLAFSFRQRPCGKLSKGTTITELLMSKPAVDKRAASPGKRMSDNTDISFQSVCRYVTRLLPHSKKKGPPTDGSLCTTVHRLQPPPGCLMDHRFEDNLWKSPLCRRSLQFQEVPSWFI